MDIESCLRMGQDIMVGILLNVRLKEFIVVGDKDVFWEGGEIIDGYDIIFSYMLKNCLFCVVNDLKDVDKNISCLDIIIKFFEKLQSCVKVEKFEFFFFLYLNVFIFVNEYIKMIFEDEVLESIKI